MKHHRTFDVLPSDRAGYVRRPLNPSALSPGRLAVHTVGAHAHHTFRQWSDWLRTRTR